MKKRLTTDNPQGNLETMLNYAYAKDKRVILQFGNGEEDIDLCDYISQAAEEEGYSCRPTPQEIMNGNCMQCDCIFAILFSVATQAAELRERLKEYEDAEERFELLHLPCKVGDTVYLMLNGIPAILDGDVLRISLNRKDELVFCIGHQSGMYYTTDNFKITSFGKTVFLTRKEAEQALRERENNA